MDDETKGIDDIIKEKTKDVHHRAKETKEVEEEEDTDAETQLFGK